MTAVYVKTLRKILYLCKFIGIININYILQSDGLLKRSTDLVYKGLEISRMIMLLILTYSFFIHSDILHSLQILKVWIIMFASRISELKLIQFMNGIIEYDQKVTSLPKFLLIRQTLPKMDYWNITFIIVFVYYISISSVLVYLWPPKTIDLFIITVYLIRLEFIVDVSVMFCSYFFLQQLEYRFQILNDAWTHLLPTFLSDSGGSTHFITGITMNKIRLLHAELSDLLRIFSDGYGKIILGSFIFCYYDMLHCLFYHVLFFNYTSIMATILPFIFDLQSTILILSIVIAASRVHEKKRKMISYLRLIRISKLSADLKIQVKLFMNQITVLESNEITAFGIFSINLNLVVSILVLLITGLVTLIQMKEHSIILLLKEDKKMTFENITDKM